MPASDEAVADCNPYPTPEELPMPGSKRVIEVHALVMFHTRKDRVVLGKLSKLNITNAIEDTNKHF